MSYKFYEEKEDFTEDSADSLEIEEITTKEVEKNIPLIKKAICDVNVRFEPSLSSKIDFVLRKDQAIEILEDGEEWSKVSGNRYIMSKYLK